MRTNSTKFKIMLIVLMTSISSTAMSATYFACAGAPLTLTATVPQGTTANWDIKKDGIQFGTPGPTAPTSFADPGTYEVILVSETSAASGLCPSEPETNTIIILPPLALTLTAPTNAAYCAANGNANSSDIVVTGAILPTTAVNNLELEYSYSVELTVGGTTTTVVSTTVGTVDQATGKFTLTTVNPGTYVITGSVKYKQLATNTTSPLLGTTGCVATSIAKQTITVTPAPAKPTITIAAS
jgi:hypothetical protein